MQCACRLSFFALLCFPQYGDNHLKEVESLWCALCTWPQNIRTTLNYFAHLTCVSGNMTLMLQQAKRVMVCFSRNQAMTIVSELMRDLQVQACGVLQAFTICAHVCVRDSIKLVRVCVYRPLQS